MARRKWMFFTLAGMALSGAILVGVQAGHEQSGASVTAISATSDASRAVANADSALTPAADPREPQSATRPSELGPPASSAAPWKQLAFSDPRGIVANFAAAVAAAKAGDRDAVREIYDLLVRCKPVMEYARAGGSRQRHIEGNALYLPPGGVADLERNFDRCALLARAPEFADWSLTGELGADHWAELGRKSGDPLFRSFEVVEALFKVERTRERPASAVLAKTQDDLRFVLRSGDGSAWVNLGSRLQVGEELADPSIGLALILVGCERGFDCTNANYQNMVLDCSFNTECGRATSLQEYYGQILPPAVNARAHARALELREMIEREDWASIERYVTLDGALFH